MPSSPSPGSTSAPNEPLANKSKEIEGSADTLCYKRTSTANTGSDSWWLDCVSCLFAEFQASVTQNHTDLSDTRSSTFFVSREFFIRGLGVIYLIAFASLWVQVEGLLGENGISPIARLVSALEGAREPGEAHPFWKLPTLLLFYPEDGALHFVCALGCLAAILLTLGLLPAPLLALLWILYLSLTNAGDVFLSFQWDILLLETGALAIFFAPLRARPRWFDSTPVPRPARWLLWWLLFRLMFASGVVKLSSMDESWWNLTALTFHYETQPLPTWLGWYLHQLPVWFQKASTLVVFFVELALPFCIFLPRLARHFAGLAFVTLMLIIAASGNYGYFNYLTIVLCLTLFDDRFWPSRWRKKASDTAVPEEEKPERVEKTSPVRRALLSWPGVAVLPLALLVLWLSPWLMLFHTFRLQAPAENTLLAHYFTAGRHTMRLLSSYHVVASYGLFANMTETRPEIVIEASTDGKEWLPLRFRWKPGELDHSPTVVQPHMPRVDWQMWFAALRMEAYMDRAPAQRQRFVAAIPWLQRFVLRIFESRPEVLSLLPRETKQVTAPRLLRLTLYQYRFTRPDQDLPASPPENWWTRDAGTRIATLKSPFPDPRKKNPAPNPK